MKRSIVFFFWSISLVFLMVANWIRIRHMDLYPYFKVGDVPEINTQGMMVFVIILAVSAFLVFWGGYLGMPNRKIRLTIVFLLIATVLIVGQSSFLQRNHFQHWGVKVEGPEELSPFFVCWDKRGFVAIFDTENAVALDASGYNGQYPPVVIQQGEHTDLMIPIRPAGEFGVFEAVIIPRPEYTTTHSYTSYGMGVTKYKRTGKITSMRCKVYFPAFYQDWEKAQRDFGPNMTWI